VRWRFWGRRLQLLILRFTPRKLTRFLLESTRSWRISRRISILDVLQTIVDHTNPNPLALVSAIRSRDVNAAKIGAVWQALIDRQAPILAGAPQQIRSCVPPSARVCNWERSGPPPKLMYSVMRLPAGSNATARAIPGASRSKQNGTEMSLSEQYWG
jgi:hypothetical protein